MSYFPYSSSSGVKTADSLIYKGPCALMGFDVTPPANGATVVTVYDADSSALGKVLAEAVIDAGFTGVNHEFFAPVAAVNGIYVTMTSTGTGSKYITRFLPG